jgi:hypothetical protein
MTNRWEIIVPYVTTITGNLENLDISNESNRYEQQTAVQIFQHSCESIVFRHNVTMVHVISIDRSKLLFPEQRNRSETSNVPVSLSTQRDFSLLRSFQTGFGANPTSYPAGTWGLFPADKVAGA